MKSKQRTYVAIDLKSFYASIECVERNLDPLTTNLVVADKSRTDKTICLAVTPSLKSLGISGRARLFEVIQKVKEINSKRSQTITNHCFQGKSHNSNELKQHPDWSIDYIIAPPQMALYMKVSSDIFRIYLKYIAPEDIHVYSCDEVFMDVTEYLDVYHTTVHDLVRTIIGDVLKQTGITATAGIGTNMYLCKVAMDIVAKHIEPDSDGVRIAELDETSYRKLLWNHRPLTSFWRIGRGIAEKLESYGIDTMGKLARCSIENEELLYRMFGVNAELLIDHAWGWEPCTIDYVKAYRPETTSISRGQVLQKPYEFKKARVVLMEMTDNLALILVKHNVCTDQLVLNIGYDHECLTRQDIAQKYTGIRRTDHYGRQLPTPARGTTNIGEFTSSTKLITKNIMALYDRIVNPNLLIRRINITANHLIQEDILARTHCSPPFQYDLFADNKAILKKQEDKKKQIAKERRVQKALLSIQDQYGKNAILKGISFTEGATAKERNKQIGGHKA